MRGASLAVPVLIAALASASCRREGDIEVSSFDLVGVEAVDEGQLRGVLVTRKGSWLPWGDNEYFDRQDFEADLKRIEAYYRDRGFPDARVTSFDVALNDDQTKVDLTVHIEEGEPVRVAEVQLEGFGVLEGDDVERLREMLPLQPEAPLDRQIAAATRERALNALRDEGYAYADVTLAEEEVAPRRTRLVLRATPGPLAYFGDVEINGETSVGEYVIRRQLTFEPGELFTRTKMRESQRKLYGLELFEFVNIESLEDRSTQATRIPIRVTVAEGKHRKVNLGVGYGSEEKARIHLRWDHVNFFGGARQAGFEGRWSSLDRGVRADLTEPYFWSPNYSVRFDAQAWQTSEPAYSLNAVGGRVTLAHRTGGPNEWSVGLINEFQRGVVSVEGLQDPEIRDDLISLGLDPRDGVHEGTLSAIVFDISRNTTTNLLDARRGYVLTAHAEQSGKWLWGDFNYWSLSGEGRHYLPIGDRFVAANRIRVGFIDGFGDVELNVPFYKRYFLGGASSVRGWGRFELSPLSGFGLPIGGHSMVEGSSELRFPVWNKVGGVVFLDYGNVWSDSFELDLGDLRYAAGPGLRYLTPIGPVRIDFAWQLTPTEELRVNGELQKRRWRIHFSIGQAF